MPHPDSSLTRSLDHDEPDVVQAADALVGRCLDGKFLLRQVIGQGSCGRVYLADQIALQRSVAVKVIHVAHGTDAALARSFHGEAFAASKLHHPNVISIYDHGQTADGLLYIAMEYLRGRTLRRLVHDEHPLPTAPIADLLMQVLSGLEEAHAAGVVHADLKSDNIVLHRLRDGGELAKIVDFGIARIFHGSAAERAAPAPGPAPDLGHGSGHDRVDAPAAARAGRVSTVSGTPGYIAPEVIAGAAPTPLADIYAAGILLYEMLTGAPPFSGNSVDEILTRHLEGAIVPPSVRSPERPIPAALEQVAMRALARDPRRRFPDAASFREALRAVGARASEVVCPRCTARHQVRSRFCSECGARLDEAGGPGRARQELARERDRGEQAFARNDAAMGIDILRSAVGMAIRLGDVALILDGYGALAAMLERVGARDEAIQELEEALDMVTAGQGDRAGAAGLWKILLKLADLYRQRGQIERALSTCARALFHVRNDASAEGRAEAQALMRRLYTESRQRGLDSRGADRGGHDSRGHDSRGHAGGANSGDAEDIDLDAMPPLA